MLQMNYNIVLQFYYMQFMVKHKHASMKVLSHAKLFVAPVILF